MDPGAPSAPADAPALIDSAVLVPAYRDAAGALRLVLIRRGALGVHAGMLAFPGGKCDPGDATRCDTALREAWEEIGLAPERVAVLAQLPVAETLTSGFRVFPFLARVEKPAQWRPDPREVSEVVEADAAELARPQAHGEAPMPFPAGPRVTPYIQVGPYRLWGVTYRILNPLLPRLLAGEWPL